MMKHRPPPDLKRLKTLYQYCHETGIFIHSQNNGRGIKGKRAGTLRPDGYIKMSVDGLQFLAHQLAWYYVYEEWEPQLDHINRKRAENWIENLRPATRAQNNGNSDGWAQQRRKHKLPRGVYHYGQCPDRYRAQIVVDYKPIHLGCFDSVEAAESAYQKAAHEYFGKFAPGQSTSKGTDGVT